MARQLRSRPQPVHVPPESVSPSASPEEWAELNARPAPPTDPDQVFRDHAANLADRYDPVAADVEAGLRRLATTFLGESEADAVMLDDALRRSPLTLLADALGVLPADAAVRLIRDGDLADLDRRVRTTAWLGSPDTPLYTTHELAIALGGFAAELHADREYLVRTGLPNGPYPGSPWLFGLRSTRRPLGGQRKEQFSPGQLHRLCLHHEDRGQHLVHVLDESRVDPRVADVQTENQGSVERECCPVSALAVLGVSARVVTHHPASQVCRGLLQPNILNHLVKIDLLAPQHRPRHPQSDPLLGGERGGRQARE